METFEIEIEGKTLRVTGELEHGQDEDSINPKIEESFNCEKIELRYDIINNVVFTGFGYTDITDLISSISQDFFEVVDKEVMKLIEEIRNA